MASPTSSTASYPAYPAHPQLGGKGLPPPVPAPAYYPSHAPPLALHRSGSGPPDLTMRYKLKAKYGKMAKRWARAVETRKDLTLELAEKEEKVQQLQDEVDLILAQIHASDYAHLRPAVDDVFSASEGEEEDEDQVEVKAEDDDDAPSTRTGKGKGRMTLEEEEAERRRAVEAAWGVDGSKPGIALPPLPSLPNAATLQQQPQPPASAAPEPRLLALARQQLLQRVVPTP
ncbi:hypothetical protein JCM10213_004189 [Rhodosporidiobolus nylandii]